MMQSAKKENTATLTLRETRNAATVGLTVVLLPKSTRKWKRKARQKEALSTREGGQQAESCLSESSSSPLPGRKEGW